MVAIVLVALLIPAYGYWHDVLHLGDTPVATVDGTTFSAQTYARYLGTRQAILARQIAQLQPLAQQAPTPAPISTAQPTPSGSPTPVANPAAVQAQQAVQALQSTEANLPTSGMSDLVEAKLIVDESKARGISATSAELDDALRWMMSPPSTQTPLVPGQGLAPVPSPLPTSGLISLTAAKQAETQIIGKGNFLNADQFTQLMLEPAVLKTKLEDKLAPNVPKTELEIHARHILVATKAEADAIEQQLKAGADFATIAKAKSTDTGSKASGGDLGWFGKGTMVAPFETAAFKLAPGQISAPVQTQFGWHIIQVLAKDPNHPLTPQQIEAKRLQPYQQWLSTAESNKSKVTFDQPSNQVMTWVQNYTQQSN